MRKIIYALFLFSNIVPFFLGAALSLDECQSLALENSEKMSIADLHALIEKDRIREVFGLGLPQLDAEADLVAAGDAKSFHKHKKANAKVSLIVPICNFGGASNLVTAQEMMYESALLDRDRIKQEILYALNLTFFRLLEAKRFEKIIDESIQALDAQKGITKDFYEQGLVHKNEILTVDVQIAQLEQDLIQAQHNTQIAQAELNRLLGYELYQPIDIEDILEYVSWDKQLDQVLEFAKANHPELLSLQAKINASKYSYKGERGMLFPSIYAFANYSTTSDYTFPYTHGIDAGIGMQLSLYDGGSTWAKLKRMKKELCELEYRYQAQEKDIEVKIHTIFLNVKSALHKIPVALKSIELAEENLNITKDHFEEGLVTNTEVINDGASLLRAHSNYYKALYEFHKAKIDLAYFTGFLMNNIGCERS